MTGPTQAPIKRYVVVLVQKTRWSVEVEAVDDAAAEDQALALFEQGVCTQGETLVYVLEGETEERS